MFSSDSDGVAAVSRRKMTTPLPDGLFVLVSTSTSRPLSCANADAAAATKTDTRGPMRYMFARGGVFNVAFLARFQEAFRPAAIYRTRGIKYSRKFRKGETGGGRGMIIALSANTGAVPPGYRNLSIQRNWFYCPETFEGQRSIA